ncbi:MAG: CocE/NonD family hydrolase [Deltaproteobacteria bacterium]|nr:CocE/NonD family hydrolase [Deltaproteobacteria bacterium]
MRSRGRLNHLQSGLLSLVIYLAAGCFQMDAPVEPGASEEPLAVSRDRAEMQIDDDGIVVQVDVPTPMRDGVRLFADVYLPDTAGPFPVILTRMPYDKQSTYGMMPALGRFWAQQGYAYVAQDVRGRFKSEGRFGRVDEISDGYDTIEWVAKQAWCNGNIGVTGESYYGYSP